MCCEISLPITQGSKFHFGLGANFFIWVKIEIKTDFHFQFDACINRFFLNIDNVDEFDKWNSRKHGNDACHNPANKIFFKF